MTMADAGAELAAAVDNLKRWYVEAVPAWVPGRRVRLAWLATSHDRDVLRWLRVATDSPNPHIRKAARQRVTNASHRALVARMQAKRR